MILNKGKYKNIEIGYGLVSLEDKTKEIKVFDNNAKNIGVAKIVKEVPLTVDVTINEDIDLYSEYFTIEPMNHTMVEGTLVKVFAFKLNTKLFGYYPHVVSTEKQFKSKTRTKKVEEASE